MILFVDAPLPVETHVYFHSVYRMLNHLLIVILYKRMIFKYSDSHINKNLLRSLNIYAENCMIKIFTYLFQWLYE